MNKLSRWYTLQRERKNSHLKKMIMPSQQYRTVRSRLSRYQAYTQVLGTSIGIGGMALGFMLLSVSTTQAQSETSPTPISRIEVRQTPANAFGDAIYGPNRDGDQATSICGRLNNTNLTTESSSDLVASCNNVANFSTRSDEVLGQIAAEEVSSEGTSAVEASNNNISARLAAVRAGSSSAIDLRNFALNVNGQRLPFTLVASLKPQAASAPDAPSTPLFGVFLNGTLTLGDKEGTTNEPEFDFHAYSLTTGADYRFTDRFVLGAALSYQLTNADLGQSPTIVSNGAAIGSANGGDIDSRGIGLSIYGTYYVADQFYIDGIAMFGWTAFDIDRNITYSIGTGPDVNQTANGNPNSYQYSFAIGAGYDLNYQALAIGPYARLSYLKLDIDAYAETLDESAAGNGWALEFNSQSILSLTSTLGVQASYTISTNFGVLLPQLRVEWEHEFEDGKRTITTRFVNDPGAQPISFATDDPDRNFFNLGIALAATLQRGLSAFLDYETVVALDNVTRYSITLGVRMEL